MNTHFISIMRSNLRVFTKSAVHCTNVNAAKYVVKFSFFHTNTNVYSSNVKIGCASGFWGDSPSASAQLIKYGGANFIIYDYLSEITMSLLTAAQVKNPELGYCPDFVHFAIGPQLKTIKEKGLKIISNAGGINPLGCAKALQEVCKKAGVNLKVGVVYGDNLIGDKTRYIGTQDMNDGNPLPSSVHSINAYLGSGPIVRCLDLGADIVITGRCTDSSLALAPLIHTFGWKWNDFDLLASGSLAGHLIECGAQVTGGIYTDWEEVKGWENIGYPVAEVSEDGVIQISKPPKTGGVVTRGTVCEQLLYEIGDPRSYQLPDVVCDFTGIQVKEVANNVVEVVGAKGKPPSDSFKVCATYLDGYKATAVCPLGGRKSALKAKRVSEAILQRSRMIFKSLGMQDFSRVHVQVLGKEDTYGTHSSQDLDPRDAVLWLSVHHQDKKALNLFSMEIASAGTSMAPGLTGIVGGRPKPTPLLKLHSFLAKKEDICVQVKLDDHIEEFVAENVEQVSPQSYEYPDQTNAVNASSLKRGNKRYLLSDLAYTRSGDKGNSVNIGVIARKECFYPYIREALSKDAVARYFNHLYDCEKNPIDFVKRYEVEGISGLNFVLSEALGGGGIASLRSDPQGKALGQMLLDLVIEDMPDIDSLV